MKLIGTLALLAIHVASVAVTGEQLAVSVKSMPPSVVKTVPQAGEVGVDPSLREVSVTFSKDMLTEQMWSWAMNDRKTFPDIDADKIHFLKDRRTCVLPVKLKPEKTYVIWVNSQKYNAFRDTENNPAVPYLLVFQTGKASSQSMRVIEKAAVSAAETWLSLVDNRRYSESWNKAAQYFKAAVSKGRWGQMIQAARKPLGKNISRELKSKAYRTSLPGAPDGKYVVIRYKASFENKKSAIETITTILDNDGKWRVSGYFVK